MGYLHNWAVCGCSGFGGKMLLLLDWEQQYGRVILGTTVLLSYRFCVISRFSLRSSDRKLSTTLLLQVGKLATMILKLAVIFYGLVITISGRISMAPCPGGNSDIPSQDECAESLDVPPLSQIRFHDANHIIAGGIHGNPETCQRIVHCHPHAEHKMRWMRDQVDIREFSQSYQGTFKGANYRSDFPPSECFKTSIVRKICY